MMGRRGKLSRVNKQAHSWRRTVKTEKLQQIDVSSRRYGDTPTMLPSSVKD